MISLKNRYTDKEYKLLIANMVIQVDNREQGNQAILDFFNKNKIQYENRSLDSGDYSFYIKKCEELGIMHDMWFDDIVVEKKSGLDELANNLKEERFFNEIKRTYNIPHKFLVIESGCIDDVLNHQYRSEYNEKAFMSQLVKMQIKYNWKIIFSQNLGYVIYSICLWRLRQEIIK